MRDFPDELIEDGDLTLRRLRNDPAEAGAVYRAVTGSVDHLAPWMAWAAGGYSRLDAAGFVARSVRNWDSGEEWNYAIVREGVIAGCCGMMTRLGPGALEIGYWVCQDQVRRGLATRSAAALTAQAFAMDGIDRVEIHHDELNVASGGIPAKLGYTRIGTEPSPMPAPAGTGVNVIWRLTRGWQGELASRAIH